MLEDAENDSLAGEIELLKPYEKPKRNTPNAPLYNIFYDLTTFFKEKIKGVKVFQE